MTNNSNYLVILAGSPRGGEIAWESLYKYVVDHLSADLAICTGNKFINEQSFISKSKFNWSFEEPENWEYYYEQNFSEDWKDAFELGIGTGLYESGFIHLAIKDMIFKKYFKIINDYDFVIYTRFDQLYVNYHPNGLVGKILIPDGEDYFGICDRHAIVSSEFYKNFFSTLDYFFDNFSQLNNVEYLNCETLNKLHLESFINKSKIYRFKRYFFTVSTRKDKTNWRIPKYRLFLFKNLKLKYPDEFIQSISYLLKNFNISKVNSNNIKLILNYFYLFLRKKFSLRGSIRKT